MDDERYVHFRVSKRFLVWSLIALALFAVAWYFVAGAGSGSGGLELGPISK